MKTRAEQAKARQSFKCLGQPGDLSLVVNFLASDRFRWVTGQAIAVNGGLVEQVNSQISNKKGV